MVGPEVLGGAAAKGVSAAASEVLGEEPSIKMSVAEKAADSPGMRKAAALRGQRAAVRQAVILQLWRPLARLVGVSKEYFEEGGSFVSDMAEKLEQVPDDQLVAPRATIAIPAMQGLGYSLDEPNLKDMYLELLAQASNTATSDMAHPAFAQIIRELQPEEARLLETVISAGTGHPLARLDRQSADISGTVPVRKHVMPFVDTGTDRPIEEPNTPVWIDNWVRLGLVRADYDTILTRPDAYDWIEDRPETEAARRDCREGQSIVIQNGVLQVTDFGTRFADVVFSRSDE